MSQTLRSRKGIGASAAIALCLAAMSAAAQDRPVTTNRPDTVKLHVSGNVVLDYVHRDAALMTIPGMNAIDAGEHGENTIEGVVAIRFDAELTEKIGLVVEIQRARAFEGIQPFFGNQGDGDELMVRRAHLKVVDFLSQGLETRMGIIDWAFDVRGNGSALAFNPFRSQSILRNAFDAQDDTGSMADRYGIGSADDLEPMGLHLMYSSGAVTVDLVALPVVGEGGPPSEDEALYALDFWYNLEQQVGRGSRLGAIFALNNLPGGGSRMFTVGAGANLVFGQLAIFGEGYLQRGEAVSDVDAEGHALSVGGRYTVNAENATWIEVSFTLYSGDDETDEELNNFVSYESVNDFLIIEDMYFGLDIDTNYTAIKIMGGTSFGVAGGKNNLELQAGVGLFTMTEEVAGLTDDEDKLGTEIDVKTRYNLSKQVALTLNFAILTGSDILEDMGGGAGNDIADDSAWLFSLGFDGRF